MPVIKCHHHGFTVSDAERSITFYRDLLGLEASAYPSAETYRLTIGCSVTTTWC